MIKRRLLKKKKKQYPKYTRIKKNDDENLRTWDKVSWKAASLESSLKPKLDDQVCYQLLSDPVPLKLPGCTKRDFLISCFYHLKELKSNFSVQQAAWHNRLNVLSSRTAHELERGQKWESRWKRSQAWPQNATSEWSTCKEKKKDSLSLSAHK